MPFFIDFKMLSLNDTKLLAIMTMINKKERDPGELRVSRQIQSSLRSWFCTMIIIANYELKINGDGIFFFCKSNEATAMCPLCHGMLKHRDWRSRIVREAGGKKSYIMIRRLKCEKCGRLHNELPDFLSPYKHYRAEIIEDVVDELVTSDDLETEDYPCEQTMERWKEWIRSNTDRINGYLKSIAYRILDFSEALLGSKISLLANLRDRGDGWLGIVNHLIYNSGGALQPVPSS